MEIRTSLGLTDQPVYRNKQFLGRDSVAKYKVESEY